MYLLTLVKNTHDGTQTFCRSSIRCEKIALLNPSRSQLCEFLLPIEVICDGASQDAAAPNRTCRGFNIQQDTLQFLQLCWAVL